MSTKAYEGVRFRARNLTALVVDMTQAFAELDRLSLIHEARFVAHEAARVHDEDWMACKRDSTGSRPAPEAFSAYVSRAWQEMRKRQQEVRATQLRDPEVDSLVEIQVWQGPGKHLYGYVHSEVKGARQQLLDSGIAEDFAYWNNSDRPENVSAAQWRHRSRVWDKLFEGHCGKSFQFLSSDHAWPDRTLVKAALPGRDMRARQLSEDEMYPLWLQAQGIEEVPLERLGSTVMRFLRECRQKPGAWRERFEARALELQTQLPDLVLD